MIKIVIALVLLAHGIGHSMGLLGIFNVAKPNPAWHGDSWLLTRPVGPTAAHLVGGVLWTAAIVGFAGVAAVVVGWLPASWWVPLAVGSCAASLAGIVFYPIAFPTFSTVGALAVDAAVLIAVLWYQWVPADLAG